MARILIIDDDVDSRNLYKHYLSKTPHEIMLAANAVEGLEYLYNYTVDILILDANMPYMNGFDLLERLRRIPRFKTLAVTLLTARREKKDIDRAVRLGANDYLIKPVDKNLFLEKINQLVPKKPLSENARHEIKDGSDFESATIPLSIKLQAITDFGVEVTSPIRLLENMIFDFNSEILDTIGIGTQKVRVENVIPDGPECWRIKMSYIKLSKEHLHKLQQWFLLKRSFERKKLA